MKTLSTHSSQVYLTPLEMTRRRSISCRSIRTFTQDCLCSKVATAREEALDQRRFQTSFRLMLAHGQMVAAGEEVSCVHVGEKVKLRKKKMEEAGEKKEE